MVRTSRGAVDGRGVDVRLHPAGEVVDLPAGLAAVYLREGWAVEDRALDEAPEVKAPPRGGAGTRRRGG